MPDASRQTVSASQVAALFGKSPYVTEWMLDQHFRVGMPIDKAADERMDAGRFLEPAILAMTAAQLRLDVTPSNRYDRASDAPIGCTRDADVIDPQLGYGCVEAKNVDFLIYREQWDEEHAPPHIELQLQAQLMVPHPTHGMPTWGVIAPLVGGNDLPIIRRLPDAKIQASIAARAREFFANIKAGGPAPDPLGTEREVDGLKWLYPDRTPGKNIVLADPEFIAMVEEYDELRTVRLENEKLEKSLRVKILGAAADAEIVSAGPFRIELSRVDRKESTVKASSYTTFKVKRTDSGA